MSALNYLFEKLNIIILNLFSALALTIFLKVTGSRNSQVLLILIAWAFILTAYLLQNYVRIKKRTEEMNRSLSGLDKKYLICEMLEKPLSCEERIYYEMLHAANKSMVEDVNTAEKTLRSYKEYVEEWVHEIKTPITAIDLICKNNSSDVSKRIRKETEDIAELVEQVLYYARSEVVEKDFFVKKVRLFDMVFPVVMDMRTLFLEKGIRIIVDETEEMVLTDEKWVQFIIKQILSNTVKYAKREEAYVHIYSETVGKSKCLVIEDNGVGIAADDLQRVCEKGFTGRKRSKKKATGMGLYLTKKLCERLEIGLKIESEEGQYTRVHLQFCK